MSQFSNTFYLLIKHSFQIKLKIPVFVGPILAIQPFNHPLTSTSLDHLDTSVPVSLGETISLMACVQPTYGAQEYLEKTCTDTALSRYKFKPWLSGASEIRNKKYTIIILMCYKNLFMFSMLNSLEL